MEKNTPGFPPKSRIFPQKLIKTNEKPAILSFFIQMAVLFFPYKRTKRKKTKPNTIFLHIPFFPATGLYFFSRIFPIRVKNPL